MDAAYQDYMRDLIILLELQEKDGEELDDSSPQLRSVIRNAVRMFYYWVNYAPLTRGSSATGYATLYASVLAAKRSFANRVPEGMQLDWEAMLVTSLDDFIKIVEDFVYRTVPAKVPSKYLDTKDWDPEFDCFEDNDNDSCNDHEHCKLQVKNIFRSYRTQTKAINWNNHILNS
jgi:hypothetical protein